MSLTCRHSPIMVAKNTLIWAEIAVAEPIILYETTKIQTNTTAIDTAHQFGAYMEGFEVVCNVSHTVMLAIPDQTQELRAPKLRVASKACLDRRMGVWCHKDANPPLQMPPSIIQGHIQRNLRGRRSPCLCLAATAS